MTKTIAAYTEEFFPQRANCDRIVSDELYIDALSSFSANMNPERAQTIIERARELRRNVSKRIERSIAAYNEAEMKAANAYIDARLMAFQV